MITAITTGVIIVKNPNPSSNSLILHGAFIALSALSTVTACSAGDGTLADDQAAFDEEAEIAEITQALNSNTNCGTANADKTYTAIMSEFTSPSSYSAGRNGCDRAYFVRVNNYRKDYTDKFNMFEYAGAQPSTKAECENTRLMVYAFQRKADGTAVFVKNVNRYGEPVYMSDGTYVECQLPMIMIENRCSDYPSSFSLATGANYQFAVSARSNESVSPVMEPIRMKSGSRIRCTPH
jgi:hypothetical protein